MRIFHTLIATALAGCACAQPILITFEAEYQDQPVALDSILVQNLTQGGDTVLYTPDTVLVLAVYTSVMDVSGMRVGAAMRPPVPNPFEGMTTFRVSVESACELDLMVYDALGNVIASTTISVGEGDHAFTFSGAQQGVFYVVMQWQGRRTVQRAVCMTSQLGADELRYAGRIGDGSETGRWKSGGFAWAPGDALRYIGYSAPGGLLLSASIDEEPVTSATQLFQLNQGAVCAENPFVTDLDGNIYPVVSIGNQCWMAQNLRTTHYSDGSIIPNVTDNTAWTELSTGAWCHYENNADTDTPFGKLYNWYAAANPTICPQGWHVPTDAEWQQLETSLGLPADELNELGYRGIDGNLGGRMKATTLWNAPNAGATNESGFSCFPTGSRSSSPGTFLFSGHYGFWWSASESDAELAWTRNLDSNSAGISRYNGYSKKDGFCLRCLQD